MIVGNGDLASMLAPYDRRDRIYYAAGVSNSGKIPEPEYERDLQRLDDTIRNHMYSLPQKKLVYFSSLCVFYSTARYAMHKTYAEQMVREDCRSYAILRLGNITWGKNPHTLINFLRGRHRAGLPLDIQPVYRYIVTPDELEHWLKLIPDWNCEMSIGCRMSVQAIADEFVYSKSQDDVLAGTLEMERT